MWSVRTQHDKSLKKTNILAGKQSRANFGIVTKKQKQNEDDIKHKCLYFIDTHFYTLFWKNSPFVAGLLLLFFCFFAGY